MNRKGLLTITILLITFFSTAYAEGKGGESFQKVTLGIELSPAFTWLNIHNDQIESDGGKLKLNVGLNAFINMTDKYAIATGLHINSYGGQLKGMHDEVAYKFNEIELPIGLKLRTGPFDDWRFTANMGLGMGILFNGSATKDIAGDAGYTYNNNNYDYKLFPLRALYNLGVGLEYDLHGAILTGRINYKGWLTSLYFYDHGIGNATKNLDLKIPSSEKSTYESDIYFKPSSLEFVLGVIF
jgi:hypothetical protein